MKNITIKFNNDKEIKVDVSEYNAVELTECINNPQLTVVNIGDYILAKHSISMISPTPEPAPEQQ